MSFLKGEKIPEVNTFHSMEVPQTKQSSPRGWKNQVKRIDTSKYTVRKGSVVYFSRQILKYDHDATVSWEGIFMKSGTVLNTKSIWRKLGIMFSLAACSALITGYFIDKPGDIDTSTAMEAISMFNALVAFLMGLFLCTIIDGWWTVREKCIGQLWSCILNLCMTVAVHLPERSDMEIKMLILRYGLLSHALIYKYAQQTDNNLQDLMEIGLLNTEELVLLKEDPHRAQVVWIWLATILRRLLFEDQKIPQSLTKNLHDQIFKGRDSIRAVTCFLDTQMPLPYVHILGITVHSFHIMISVVGGINFLVGYDNSSYQFMSLQIVFIVCFGVIYEGILSIARKLQNPLGNHYVDLNRLAYHCQFMKQESPFLQPGKDDHFLKL